MPKHDLPHFLRSKGKAHLLITGRKGVGKTTLFNQLLCPGCQGLRTTAQWKGGATPSAIVMADLSTGERAICALPGQGRMVAVAAGFAQVGVPALVQALGSDASVFYMDEIGYLEWSQQDYCHLLLALFDEKTVVAVLKKEVSPLYDLLSKRQDVYVLDLDEER